jgi:CTP:molybdopterin cytidylyltransferase MocA
MPDSPFSFASIQNAGDAPVMPDPPEMQNLRQGLAQTPQLQANLQGLQDFQVNQKLTSDMNSNPAKDLESISFNQKDGSFTAKGSQQALESLMRDRQQLNEIRGAFHQQSMQYAARAEAQRNQPPWVQLATSLAGNLASAPNMPGWVQALGKTSQELNPRADTLQAVQRNIMTEEAQIAEKSAGLDIGALHALMTGGHQVADLALKQNKEVDQVGQKLSQGIRLATKNGVAPDEETIRGLREIADPNHLLNDAQVGAAVKAASGLATSAAAGLEAAQARKKDLLTMTSDLATQRGIKLAEVGAGQKLGLMREAFNMNHGQTALDFERAKREIDAAATLKLAQLKSTGVISPSDSQKLQSGISTNTYLGSLTDMLQKPELRAVAEPLFVVDRGKDGGVEGVRVNPEAALPKAWQSLSKVEADNMINHEMPRILGLLFKQGVGAQMFRSKEGMKILGNLGVTNSMRADQMDEVLKTIRETNNLSNFQPVAVTKPGVLWSNPENAAMLAMDDPQNADFWAGKGRFGGAIPVKNPAGAKGPTISKDDYDEWLKKQGTK